jgi:hypothetical protein
MSDHVFTPAEEEWLQRTVANAPPMTPDQARRIGGIIARAEAAQRRRRAAEADALDQD